MTPAEKTQVEQIIAAATLAIRAVATRADLAPLDDFIAMTARWREGVKDDVHENFRLLGEMPDLTPRQIDYLCGVRPCPDVDDEK